MKKIYTIVLGLFFAIVVISTAEANLINNGSFETPEIGGDEGDITNIAYSGGSSWTVFKSIDGGWTTLDGQGIEIQENGTVSGVTTEFGDQYVELDSHPAPGDTRMGQDVNLTAGAYELSFYYTPRTSNSIGTNGIRYGYADMVLGSTVFSNGWVQYSSIFNVADAGIYTIWFESFGAINFDIDNDTVGGFIDNVALNSVPEPASMLLIGTGLIGLAGISRKKKK